MDKPSSLPPSIERIADLQMFIARFSTIERVPELADTGRRENDIDHSFGLALTSWFLAPKIAPELNLEKILCFALAHDTVEVYAGDTFVFAPQEVLDSKSQREDDAIDQLRIDWPDFPDMVDAAANYKNKINEEARFVYAVDKLLPVLMINLGEKGTYWNRHKITLAMQKAEKRDKILVSSYVAPYYEKLVTWMTTPDYFYKPRK